MTTFPTLPSTLTVGDDPMRATLAEAMAAPSTGQATTIMLDQSMPGQEGAKSRLANVIAALQDRIKALPASAVVGLWTFDGHEGRSEVASGPLADPVGGSSGQPRSAALLAALDKQYSSGGGAVSFTTLRMIYQDMQANYHAGQANSLLVITSGPHTDQTLDGPGLQDFIRKSADPAKPIAVNVIDFGADPDRSTWEAVAQLSGGSYQNIATSASPSSRRRSTPSWVSRPGVGHDVADGVVHGKPENSDTVYPIAVGCATLVIEQTVLSINVDPGRRSATMSSAPLDAAATPALRPTGPPSAIWLHGSAWRALLAGRAAPPEPASLPFANRTESR